MDEVHIHSDVCYKGDTIIGYIEHPDDQPTTVFSIMVSSLAKRFSTIVRLIPFGSSSPDILFHIVKEQFQKLNIVVHLLKLSVQTTTH